MLVNKKIINKTEFVFIIEIGEGSRFGFTLWRKKIKGGEMEAADIDHNFLNHELREQELEAGGMDHDAAHEQVLKEQNMWHGDYEKKLYTQEALDASNAKMHRKANSK
jgi:hypothetical protein